MKETKYKKELVEFDVEKAYKTEEVMEMLKKQPKRKFVESVDVAVKLGIDPKKSDQNVRGALTLPNSLGKKITVVAFVEGCLLYTSPSPRDRQKSRMPSSA